MLLLTFSTPSAHAQTRVESVLTVSQMPSELRPDDARLERLERWVFMVAKHSLGSSDDLSRELATWNLPELQALWVDASSLSALMRDDRRGDFRVSMPNGGSTRIVYPSQHLQRLQRLACVTSGYLDATSLTMPPDHIGRRCIEATSLNRLDPILRDLATWFATERRRRGDDNLFWRRSALLHSDVAMLEPALAFPVGSASLPVGPRRVRIELRDGRSAGITLGGIHWSLAETLLSFVKSVDATKPNPQQDAMVRGWYQATTMWMQRQGQHDLQHLEAGLTLFPDDALLLFLSGCEYESYASDAIQVSLDSSNRASATVHSARDELRQAAGAFAHSQQIRPSAETQLHRGHVQAELGEPADALETLGTIAEPFSTTSLQYLFEMFTGDTLERMNRLSDAVRAYERARALIPAAQSAAIALSQAHLRADSLVSARDSAARLWAAPSDNIQDPWWDYATSHAASADSLVEAVWRSVE